MAGVLSLSLCKTYNMQNTLIPASFLSVALSNQKSILKSDNNSFLIRETDTNHFSRLYTLFFGDTTQLIKQPEVQQLFSEPDEYSSYE
jgi:uncharacterized protein YdeI (YjbR/CyaY-like superfamily)